MAIVPKGLGAEIGVQIRQVWMGSHLALPDCADAIAYAPAVVVYLSAVSGTRCVYPLNPDMAPQMRDRLRLLGEERPKPKTAGERYRASKDAKGLSFKFDTEDAGIFVADVNASGADLGHDAAGSISFKSRGLDGVELIAFSREEFAEFAKVVAQAIDAHAAR